MRKERRERDEGIAWEGGGIVYEREGGGDSVGGKRGVVWEGDGEGSEGGGA